MKLDEINSNKGTYVGVRFSSDTMDILEQYNKENSIPNPLKRSKMHSTILYSRKHCPNYIAPGILQQPEIARAGKFDVFTSTASDGTVSRCLVVKLNSPYLQLRHTTLMHEHSATFDYPTYTPHITLSYDIGDMDITNLPPLYGDLEIVEEYGMDLDLDWAVKNSK